MTPLLISPAQRKELRGLAHHLDPVVHIGAEGLAVAVQAEIDRALSAHGLIKVRVFSDDRTVREALLARLSEALGAAAVQHIGKLLVLWRPIPLEAETSIPVDRQPGPRIVKVLKFSKSGNHRPQVKKLKVLGNERVTVGGEIKRARKRKVSVKKLSAA
jgi:putative YhbY family RNA-binding protein